MGADKFYQKIFAILCGCLLLQSCYPAIASAASPVELSALSKALSMQDDLSWYQDPSGELDFTQALSSLDQFHSGEGRIRFAQSTGAYWFYLRLKPVSVVEQSYLLELAFSQLDRIDLYHRSADMQWQHQIAGDVLAGLQDTFTHRFPLFELMLSNTSDSEILIRVQSSTSIVVPLYLWNRTAFENQRQHGQLLSGLYYGILLALVLYNLFLYPTVRDTAYLWFAFYLGMFALFHFSLEGYARLYFWPDSPLLADRAVSVFICLTMAGGLRFTQLISLSAQYAPRLHRLFTLLIFLVLVVAVLTSLLGPAQFMFFIASFGALVALLIPLPIIIAWRAGYRAVRFALIAFVPIFPGAILIAARSANLIEASYYTENLFSLGTAIAAIMLSFALADRINLLREDKLKAQEQLLLATHEASLARRQFSTQLIEMQDKQRQQIAADLHDGVSQNLSLLANTIYAINKQADPQALHIAQQLAHESLDEIRAISHELHPHILDQIGLTCALETIVERINQQGQIHCELNTEPCIENLQPATRLHLYRIIQEALNNAQRHSQADQLWVDMSCARGRLELNIRDNGIGITQGQQRTGLGLESIRQRVELLQGVVQFAENSPSGASIQIEIAL